MTKQVYIVSIAKKDGTQAFLGMTTSTIGLVLEPGSARQFTLDTPKSEIVAWIDKVKNGLTRTANLDTLRVVIFETNLVALDTEDIEWKTALQRSAVSKLLRMEIEALGLEKYEIERRMSED